MALHFVHDPQKLEEIRGLTRDRIVTRGDSTTRRSTPQTDETKFLGVMDGFIDRFEPCNPFGPPDDGFDSIIDLDPTVGSRKNLEVVIEALRRDYPNLIKEVPTAEQMDEAITAALGYAPTVKHNIPDPGPQAAEPEPAAAAAAAGEEAPAGVHGRARPDERGERRAGQGLCGEVRGGGAVL